MYKIVTICVNGVGTSIMAKRLVSNSIQELGYDLENIDIDETSMSKIDSVHCDLIVTTVGLISRIPQNVKDNIHVVTVANMISGKNQMKEALKPYLQEALNKNLVRLV